MEYDQIPTTTWLDVIGSEFALSPNLKPLNKDIKLWGYAYTVKLPKGDNLELLKAILKAPEGSVIVVDSSKNDSTAVIGDLYTTAAQKQGIKGFVIDGLVRDYLEIIEVGLPVFCKGYCAIPPKKLGGGIVGETICCGNKIINSGDIIIGDQNGVICLPPDNINSLFREAQKKEAKNCEIEKRLNSEQGFSQEFLTKLIDKYTEK